MRMDQNAIYPSGMREYLDNYGWHFSKKMCDFAVSRMYRKDEAGRKVRIEPYTKEAVMQLLKAYNVTLEHDYGYDACFAANMCKSDYFKSSIKTEQDLAQFVKDYVDDPDAYEGLPFTRYYADTIGAGIPILWEEMM